MLRACFVIDFETFEKTPTCFECGVIITDAVGCGLSFFMCEDFKLVGGVGREVVEDHIQHFHRHCPCLALRHGRVGHHIVPASIINSLLHLTKTCFIIIANTVQ